MADGSVLPAVYTAIAAVMEEIGREGIAKGRRNKEQGYQFRGIDDVYNALAPILSRNKLVIVPRMLSREKSERTTQRGGVLFYVVMQAEFDIICATDGSKITAATWGEAMDSADKATNKAMSAAYKYMAMQTFCIPTEGDNDADDTTHDEIASATEPRPQREAPPRREQEAGAGDRTSSAPAPELTKADQRVEFAALQEEIRRCTSSFELIGWGQANARRVEFLNDEWKKDLRKQYTEMLDGLRHIEKAKADAHAAEDEDMQELVP